MPSRAEIDFAELAERFRGLSLVSDAGAVLVRGPLGFSAEYAGVIITDCYSIEIDIPLEYPSAPPSIKECDGRIPPEFHMSEGGVLCLGSSLDVKMKFDATPTLLGYVTTLVIPYLFSFSCKEKYGVMPYGELPHGGEGVLKYYRELFGVQSDLSVVGLLVTLATDSYRGHAACPCGSGERLRKCHGPTLMRIGGHLGPAGFLGDLAQCASHLAKSGMLIPESILNRKTVKLIAEYVTRITKKEDTTALLL